MPKSSRHKSKRSAKDTRDYSDIEEDAFKGKHRDGKDEGGSRGYTESGSGSGDKRKLASQSVVVKDSSGHGNGYSSEEYGGSKKRKDKSSKPESDRWSGSGEVLSLESEIREERSQFDGKALKPKGLILLKSKVGSAKHDLDKKEENMSLVIGKDETRSGRVDSKRRLEKDTSEKEKLDRDLNRKDAMEKEMGSERDNRLLDSKRGLDNQSPDEEDQKFMKGSERKDWPLEDEHEKCESEKDSDRRRKKRTGVSDDNDKYLDRKKDNKSDINATARRERDKDGRDRDEIHKDISIRDKHYWPSEEVYGKNESEKERETRRRKRTDESNEKDKSQDYNRDNCDIIVTSRHERDKDGRDRDERHKGISSRDKIREYYDRDNKGRDVDRREGTDRDRAQKTDDYTDDHSSRDHVGSKNDSKFVRGEADTLNSRYKKSRTDISNVDSSIKYDDQGYRYKDYKETRRSVDKEEYGDMRSWGAKEYLESEKKSTASREETASERERSISFHHEESNLGQSRRTHSPSAAAHGTRDQYRYSKQSEFKYRKSLPEEVSRIDVNYGKEGDGPGVPDRAHSSRAVQKGDVGRVSDFSSERHRNTERRASPMRLADKSQSPSSIERRHLSRSGDRRSLDYEDSGHRSNSYKDANYHYYDGTRNQDVKMEAPSMDGSSQVHGDNMHVSSSFNRSGRIPGNSRSFLPPPSPLKHGVDNPYVGSSEEDSRGKLNNRPNRPVDSSMGRMQGNAWWGAPNWPPHMANGFLPFPHGPGAVGFHPMMQQFPPQMFGVRPPIDPPGVPFHISDGDRFPGYGNRFGWQNSGDETCPSPMQNWDSNNMVPGEGYAQGSQEWDQSRSLMSGAGRESSVDQHKGSNSATMESPSGRRQATAEPIDNLSTQSNPDHQVYEDSNENQLGSKLSSEMYAPFKNISDRMSDAKFSQEKKEKLDDIDDHVRRSCAYLSKIDISASLAHSDLFDQCVSLLGIKHDILSDTRNSEFTLEEENDVEVGRTTFSSYISCGPVFAEVSGSLLEKAMSLYRQHRDDTLANYLSDKSNGNQLLPSHEVEGSEPTCLDGRMVSSDSTESQKENDRGHMCPGLIGEFPVSDVNEDKATRPNIHPMLEVDSPTLFGNADVDVPNKPGVPVNAISTSDEVKDELMSVSDRKMSENADGGIDVGDGKKTVEVKNSASGVDDEATVVNANITTANHGEAGSHVEVEDGMDEEEAAVKTATGEPTTPPINVSFELNEVNICRIHRSPESTH